MVNADAFFPLLVYVLVWSDCGRTGPHACLAFVRRFRSSTGGEASYYWAAMEAAVAWVEESATLACSPRAAPAPE